MRGTAQGAIALAGAVALAAACGGNGATGGVATGSGSSGGTSDQSGSSGGSTSGASGSSSGGSGFTGSDDASVSGSDDGPNGNSGDTGTSDGASDASGVLDTGSSDGAQTSSDGSLGGNDAGTSSGGTDAGSSSGGTDAGSSSGADAGSSSGADAGSSGGADAGSSGGGTDAGSSSGGTDAGSSSGGTDAGSSGADAGHGNPDAGGSSGGADAGHDAGNVDAGFNDNGSTPTMIPTPTGTCPTIPNTGTGSSVLTYAGNSITVWAGAAPTTPGPLVIYWYATGGTPAQAVQALGGQAGIDKITSLGGVVVAPNATTRTGNNTGDMVWYTGDVAQVDEVVGCAVQQHRVDPRHIHVLGYSAGALQTVYMWFARSGYVASVLSYSGGDVTIDKTTMQDPSNIPPAVVAHGAMGMDTFPPVDFYTASHTWETDIQQANGFDIDCNDGSTHIDETTRFKIAPEGVQFFLDHPFKASPDPYANGLPSAWPSYCTIANK